jgi:DNA-binding IscR family transcriptional regulator
MSQSWGLITNHALVMIYVTMHRACTVREISAGIGVTERAALAILRELDDEGIVVRTRDGRRNTYSVDFRLLAAYRRLGAASRTPRTFVDTLVLKLIELGGEGHIGTPADISRAETLPRSSTWGFFTNHMRIVLATAQDSDCTVREMAMAEGLTERAVITIYKQLADAGIVKSVRQGRRNSYFIDVEAFGSFPRWSGSGTWHLPPELIEMAVQGLSHLMARPVAGGRTASRREAVGA